jgi:hypothetical protein
MAHPYPLGRSQEHDPRSLSFPAPTDSSVRSTAWRRYGTVLDQGNVGSCTGNAAAQALNHAPFHQSGTRCLRETDALTLYSAATTLDNSPETYPPDDTGSSGLAVAKAARAAGLIGGYLHAFDLDHVLSAAMSGPLIVGSDWLDGMFEPDASGFVHLTGSVAGGHEYVLDGVNLEHQRLRFLNSWSANWGRRGRFFMSFDDFAALLDDGGDAVLFVR